MIQQLNVSTHQQGLLNITHLINTAIKTSNTDEGLCTIFIQHTSASLIIQENADPSAKHDLERWLNRLVKENDSLYTHTSEGPDDMPSHIKSILTATSLSVPIQKNRLALGVWQGVYLWEHRKQSHTRTIIVHTTP